MRHYEHSRPRTVLAAAFLVVAAWAVVIGGPGVARAAATMAPGVGTPATGVSGWVWASQPSTASYVAGTGYEYSSVGGSVEITRSGAGNYTVKFAGLGTSGGVAHVQAYGAGNSRYCVIWFWQAIGADEVLHVRCFDASGSLADTKFVANFTRRTATSAPYLTYLWSDDATPAVPYTPAAAYRFDTHGAPPQVEREGTGAYLVWDDTFDASPMVFYSHIQVTAYGPAATHCAADGEGTEASPFAFRVRCTDADGDAVDSRFTFTFVLGGNLHATTPATFGNASAFATAAEPSHEAYIWWSTGGQPAISLLGVGRYQLRFPGLAQPRGFAIANPLADEPRHCTVANWWPSGPDEVVNVECYDSTSHLPAAVNMIAVAFTQ